MPTDLRSIRDTLMQLRVDGPAATLIDPLVQLVEAVREIDHHRDTQLASVDGRFAAIDQWLTKRAAVVDDRDALIAGLRKENNDLNAAHAELVAQHAALANRCDEIESAIAAYLDEQSNRWSNEYRRNGNTRAGYDAANTASAWSDAATAVREGKWRRG
jgi:peptidoglycan hydrolase CwlO-like protein